MNVLNKIKKMYAEEAEIYGELFLLISVPNLKIKLYYRFVCVRKDRVGLRFSDIQVSGPPLGSENVFLTIRGVIVSLGLVPAG